MIERTDGGSMTSGLVGGVDTERSSLAGLVDSLCLLAERGYRPLRMMLNMRRIVAMPITRKSTAKTFHPQLHIAGCTALYINAGKYNLQPNTNH